MQTEVEGIVLKETLYGETSKILQVITREKGLIGIMAKGASSYKSNLHALALPFLYGKFLINYKDDKLSVLKGGTPLKLYVSGTKNLKIYAYMSFLSELTYKVMKENNDKQIYYIFKNGLDKISDGLNCEVIKNIIELKYLSYIGIAPNLDICQKCFQSDSLVAIDGKIGGFICSNCYTNEKKVPDNFQKILNRYLNVDISEINEIKINKENQELINEFIKEYYDTFSSIYINSRSFLDSLK